MKGKQELRKSQYKKGVDVDDSRRKREDKSTGIRKQKREENLWKKRNVFAEDGEIFSTFTTGPMSELSNSQQAISGSTDAELLRFVEQCLSPDPEQQLKGTTSIRKLLSVEKQPPINEVIRCGIIPKFVEFLQAGDKPQLQFEAAWALTNVLSGNSEQTLFVINSGAPPHLVNLLKSQNPDVAEQATWAVGNIAGEGARYRDMVIQYGAMDYILALYMNGPSISMIRNATWALANLCRGKPSPAFTITSKALPILNQLLMLEDEGTIIDTLWALSYITDDGSEEKLEVLIKLDFPDRLIKFLSHDRTGVQIPALRVCGNIVTGTHDQTEKMVRKGLIPPLVRLIQSPKKILRKECCWVISNITAGTQPQIDMIFEAGLIPLLFQVLEKADFDVKKEATWALTNITSGGSKEHFRRLVELGFIRYLCEMLSYNDTKMVELSLQSLEVLLEWAHEQVPATKENFLTTQVEEFGGVERLEKLQTHANTKIFQKCSTIVEKYFDLEEDEEEEEEGAQPFKFGNTTFDAAQLQQMLQQGGQPAQQQQQQTPAFPQFQFNFGQQNFSQPFQFSAQPSSSNEMRFDKI